MSRAWDQLAQRHGGRHDPEGSLPERLHARLRGRVLAELESLPAGATVLDLGCGRGDLANELVRRRPDLKVLGMDVSSAMLSCAAAEAAAPGNPAWILGDATRWPLPDASVDAVVALDLLAHLEPRRELPAMLAEARRVCRGLLYAELKSAFSLRLILALRRLLAWPRLARLRAWWLGLEAGDEPIPIHAHARVPWPAQASLGALRPWPLLPAPSLVHRLRCSSLHLVNRHD